MVNKQRVSRINQGWCWYSKGDKHDDINNVGKFMTFGSGDIPDSLQDIILEAIDLGVTTLVKHTDPETAHMNQRTKDGSWDGSWVVIWYCSDNMGQLQRLASFMVDNDLIQRTKTGRLHNISFKYDTQTRMGQYGAGFTSRIKLEDLLDLNTGEPLQISLEQEPFDRVARMMRNNSRDGVLVMFLDNGSLERVGDYYPTAEKYVDRPVVLKYDDNGKLYSIDGLYTSFEFINNALHHGYVKPDKFEGLEDWIESYRVKPSLMQGFDEIGLYYRIRQIGDRNVWLFEDSFRI